MSSKNGPLRGHVKQESWAPRAAAAMDWSGSLASPDGSVAALAFATSSLVGRDRVSATKLFLLPNVSFRWRPPRGSRAFVWSASLGTSGSAARGDRADYGVPQSLVLSATLSRSYGLNAFILGCGLEPSRGNID